MKPKLTGSIRCRLEEDQAADLEFYARQNGHKPGPFLRAITNTMLAIVKQNNGCLPNERQLQLVLPIIMRPKK